MWIGVRERFAQFHADLLPTQDQARDALTKQLGVRQSLQRAYYGVPESNPPGLVVGSWGKGTQTRPPKDIDVLAILPVEVFHRIQQNVGNRQSALLQQVKYHLEQTYPQSDMRGDGQVVVVAFNTITVEVVPIFAIANSQQFFMPDTNANGRWKLIDPWAEIASIDASDQASNGNTRRLVRMIKIWKRECQGLAIPNVAGGGLLIGFATAPGDVALDGEGGNSPFTKALLKHLPTRGIEIQQVMTRIKSDVYQVTGKQQRPWHNSDLRAEFYLNPQ